VNGRLLFIVRLAVKNIGRRYQRSLIMVGAVAFAIFIAIYYAALTEGLLANTERNAVLMESGYIQVHAPAYLEEHDFYQMVSDPDRVVRAAATYGLAAAPRLFGFSLAALGDNSAGVEVRGIEPSLEDQVTRLSAHLLEGAWVDQRQGVVLGNRLARKLGAKIGDKLLLLGQAADGSMANDLFRVRGILKPVTSEIDQGTVIMSAADFRRFFVLPTGVHEMALGGRNLDRKSLASISAKLAGRLPGLEVKSWRELSPVLARVLDSTKGSLFVMLLLIYAAMAILILNAVLMGVFERIREFGVMRAVGLPPIAVFLLVLVETAILTLLGGGLGVAVAVPLIIRGETHPIDLTALAADASTIAGVAIDPFWYTRLTWEVVSVPFELMIVVALVAALYPAGHAAFIKPVEALKND